MKTLRACVVLACSVSAAICGAAPSQPKSSAGLGAQQVSPDAEKIPPIEGLEIKRGNGEFLGLRTVENHFVLTFYDAKKKKIAPDVPRATVRWPVKYQPSDERTVLTLSGDGQSLTSARTVRAPHRFKVYLSLFADDSDTPVESFTLDYNE